MSMYKGAKTLVKVGGGHSEELDVGVGVHQGLVLSPFLFSIVLYVLSQDGRKGALYKLIYADDLVLMAETMEELEAQFILWKAAFEEKGFKVNLGRQRSWRVVVVVRLLFWLRLIHVVCVVNCVRCKTYKKWIHARCARVKSFS